MYLYTKGTLHLHQSTHMKIFRYLFLLLILSATPLEASRYVRDNSKRLSFTYNYIFVKGEQNSDENEMLPNDFFGQFYFPQKYVLDDIFF